MRTGLALAAALWWGALPLSLAQERATAPLLPQFDPATILTPERADEALQATDAERARLDPIRQRAEYECYQRFLVNRCLERLRLQSRIEDLRLRTIDVQARQVLRNEQARRRNADEADAIESRAEDARAAQARAADSRPAESRVPEGRASEAGAAPPAGAQAPPSAVPAKP